MTARILDGKALAQRVRQEVAAEVGRLKEETTIVPGLAVVLVGDDPASAVYVRNKQNACKAAGMLSSLHRLPAETSQAALLETIDRLNTDPMIHGILVQLPLPRQIDEWAVLSHVNPLKDVDGFHPVNVGLLTIGAPRFVPCTPLGIRALLLDAGVATRGAHAVVLGRSQIVGKPMALLLMQKGPGGDATVSVCHTATRDAAAIAREADILVAAVGRPEHVRADWIKPGAVVIDVGIHRRDDGTLCGDVHFPSVASVASLVTPVPGGVGPMTVAMLLKNTLRRPALPDMSNKTLRALDQAIAGLDRAAKRPRGGFSTAPFILTLSLILGYQLLVRLVPMIWSQLLPGGLDQAAALRGWPGLVWQLALLCHHQFLEVSLVAGAIALLGFLMSRRGRLARLVVWLGAVAGILLDAGILYVAMRTSMETTFQNVGLG